MSGTGTRFQHMMLKPINFTTLSLVTGMIQTLSFEFSFSFAEKFFELVLVHRTGRQILNDDAAGDSAIFCKTC